MTTTLDTVRVSYDAAATQAVGETIFVVRNLDNDLVTFGQPRQVHDWLVRHGYCWIVASRGLWRTSHVREADRRA